MFAHYLILTVLAGLTLATAHASPIDQAWLKSEAETVRAEHDLVALGVAVATPGGEPAIAVTGQRWKGSDEAVTPEDAWHIGSNTKALTALLYARLVDQGKAEWGASLPELFPDLADDIHPAWADVTIEDLFAHRSGVGDVGMGWLIARNNDSASLTEQRLATVGDRLSEPPPGETGTFHYSNLNYIIAGSAIEQVLGTSWEAAITEHVFKAGDGGSEGWGFGPPQDGLQGHKRQFGLFMSAAGRNASADNPKALGPAGTLHARLESHAELLLHFVNPDSSLISPDMRQHLLAPWPDETADYAMGWGVIRSEDGTPRYGHAGSNTMWLSRVLLLPDLDAVIVVNTNQYTPGAQQATGALIETIIAELEAGN